MTALSLPSSSRTCSSSWLGLAQSTAELLLRRVLRSRYIPHRPTTKQAAFLALTEREALYGGAAGGGKSDALLMAALMFADVPGYAAILFRRTFADLALPQALMARAHEWLQGTDAHWNERDKTWTFPVLSLVYFPMPRLGIAQPP